MAVPGPGLQHLNGLYAAAGRSGEGVEGPKLGTVVFPTQPENELIDTIRAAAVDEATIACSGFVAGRTVVAKTYRMGRDFKQANGVISLGTKPKGMMAGDGAGMGMATTLQTSTIRALETGDLALRQSGSVLGVAAFAPGAIIPLVGMEKRDFIYRRLRD